MTVHTGRTLSLSAIAERNPSYAATAYIKKNRDGKAVSLCRSFTILGFYGDRIAGLVYRRSYNGNYVYIFSWPDCFGRGPLAPMSCRSLFSPRPRSFLLQRKDLIIEESILLSNQTRRALESNQSLDVGNKATTATPKIKEKRNNGPTREKRERKSIERSSIYFC
jgi:hypothetical protein